MKGLEQDLRDMSVAALRRAHDEVRSLKCAFAVESVKVGKSDTYGLDAIPEEVIKQHVADYDGNIVLITEETGKMYSGEQGLEPTQTVLICDPTDRSIKMREFLRSLMAQDPACGRKSVGEAFRDHLSEWEEELGNPTISGASASITAVRDSRILFNCMVNYATGDLFIADSVGTRRGKITEYPGMEPVEFSSRQGDARKFVTFLRKDGYPENMEKCNLGLLPENCVDPWTGGPLRILVLSELNQDGVSFILSNGEKICEWIGWLSWVKYASDRQQHDERALEAFRVFFESPRTKELVLVAPGPHYSIFTTAGVGGHTRLNLDRMFQLADPSHYRETILVTPRHNVAAIARVMALGEYQEQLRL